MPALPTDIAVVIAMFAPLFSQPTVEHVKLLVVGAILAPGRGTVTAVLPILGLAEEPQVQRYHRVLNRACWSPRRAAGILLQALVAAFGGGVLVFGLEETLERRRRAKIAAKGIYRDAVRSSHSFFVKASGLRWISMMLLAPIPRAGRVWALPFFTVLAPSERGLPHKTLSDWACQMVSQLRRWLPHQAIVLLADSTYAVLAFLHHCRQLANPLTLVTRLRPLADRRPAGRTDSLGADPRPERRVPSPSFALHRPLRRPGTDHLRVCRSLANGDHLPGGAHASGPGNPAPGERPGDRPHYPGFAGAVLAGDADGPSPFSPSDPTHSPSPLVSQTPAHLRRRHRPGALPNLAFPGFCHVLFAS